MRFLAYNSGTEPARIKPRKNEQAYVRDAHRRLRKSGIPCKWEAALLGRSIDLVFFLDNAVFSVEFKLKDWRKGLEQAKDHQIGADFAYLCLPGKRITPALWEEATHAGVGIFAFQDEESWPFAVALEARLSTIQWSVARERLIDTMKRRKA